MVKPILRLNISSLTPEIFVQRYQKTGTPLIITGLLDTECDWNLDYLCRANASKFHKTLLTKILAYVSDERMGFIVELIFYFSRY
jgi:hypothetical protein